VRPWLFYGMFGALYIEVAFVRARGQPLAPAVEHAARDAFECWDANFCG
jgi:hypothetical protein